jgi:hypothetical protein
MTKEVLSDGQRTEVNTHKSTSSRNYLAATARLDVEFKSRRTCLSCPVYA